MSQGKPRKEYLERMAVEDNQSLLKYLPACKCNECQYKFDMPTEKGTCPSCGSKNWSEKI